MDYLICYDIADDNRRSRTAELLLDFGRRVQHSVFFAHLDAQLAKHLGERLSKTIDESEDSLIVVPLCAACSQRTIIAGKAELPEDRPWYVL